MQSRLKVETTVIIKLLNREYPSFNDLLHFRHQYTIVKDLPISGIIHPLSFQAVGNSYALIMEDFGGVSLAAYAQQYSFSLTEILDIAKQVADILHELYQHRVVHKDIKPANLLIHPETQEIKLIDFSIATQLSVEIQGLQSPTALEGTLAYMAPEQTGRMNRGVDFRADYYALGVTLYELFASHLPFQTTVPLELLHCHIAKHPIPLDQIKPTIPENGRSDRFQINGKERGRAIPKRSRPQI